MAYDGTVFIRDNDEENFNTLITFQYNVLESYSEEASRVLEFVDMSEREIELRAIAPGTTEIVIDLTGQVCPRNWSGGPPVVISRNSEPLRITVVGP